MKTDKATITIPYDEFAKHQEQVKEIEWARDIKAKMDNGDLIDFREVGEKLMVFGEYIAIPNSFGTAKVDFYIFAQQKGFEVAVNRMPNSKNNIVTINKIKK